MIGKIKIDKQKLRKITRTNNPFLSLASSIIYQQISTGAGNSIYKKFLKLFKGKPAPEKFLKLSDKKIREAGISPKKLSYLRDLAQKFSDKPFQHSLEHWNAMNEEEVRALLLQIKGIGNWTVDMFLIFALNKPDVLPVGDLGIKKGFQKVFNLRKLPSEKQMKRLAAGHRGELTNLSLYLWNSLEKN